MIGHDLGLVGGGPGQKPSAGFGSPVLFQIKDRAPSGLFHENGVQHRIGDVQNLVSSRGNRQCRMTRSVTGGAEQMDSGEHLGFLLD